VNLRVLQRERGGKKRKKERRLAPFQRAREAAPIAHSNSRSALAEKSKESSHQGLDFATGKGGEKKKKKERIVRMHGRFGGLREVSLPAAIIPLTRQKKALR